MFSPVPHATGTLMVSSSSFPFLNAGNPITHFLGRQPLNEKVIMSKVKGTQII
jgi:hypothetical protein